MIDCEHCESYGLKWTCSRYHVKNANEKEHALDCKGRRKGKSTKEDEEVQLYWTKIQSLSYKRDKGNK